MCAEVMQGGFEESSIHVDVVWCGRRIPHEHWLNVDWARFRVQSY